MNQNHENEEGFALPFTLLLVTLLTVMLTSAFTRLGSDIQIADSSEAGVDALAIAQSGLSSYLIANFSARPRSMDSIRYNVPGGYAWVVPQVLETPPPPDTLADYKYIVRSTGYVIDPSEGSTPLASRSIAQFALWQTGNINELAAITAANGIERVSKGIVEVFGDDQVCGGTESTLHTRRPKKSSSYTLEDSSNVRMETESAEELANATGIDWATVAGGGFPADYNSFQAWDATYPSMLVDGDLTLTDTGGYGLLVVTGDLTTQGSWNTFTGVIVVGGRVRFQSDSDVIYGVVISGMDEQLGSSPKKSEVGGNNRNTVIYYAPCEVDNALKSLTGFIALENTWVDNWADWEN